MMKRNRVVTSIGAALLIGFVFSAVPGCQKHEGPVERTGKEIDKTVEKVGKQIEKAGDSLQDTAKSDKK